MKVRDVTDAMPETNYSRGRRGQMPGLITLHIAEGSYNGTCSWFLNPRSGVSSHYVISKKGEVTKCVNIEDTAYVNGTTLDPSDSRYHGNSDNPIVKARKLNANLYTVGIEFEGYYDKAKKTCEMTEEQVSAAVKVIAHIVKESKEKFGNDIPIDSTRICGHCDVAPKWKPFCGKGFPYDRIIREVRRKLGM